MSIVFASIIFLFTVYVLSKDDFLFMRKNVSLKTIFDISIITGIIGIFFSRLFFVFMHPSSAYFNPLVFFVIPYFPGLSSAGFIFGMFLALYFFIVRKKLPMGKIYDIFSLALTASGGGLFLGFAIEELIRKHFFFAGLFFICFFLLFLLFNFLKKLSLAGSVKDGSIALVALTVICTVSVVAQAMQLFFKSIPKEFPYFLLLFFIILISFLVKTFKKAGEKS